jgi:hypothetical protein
MQYFAAGKFHGVPPEDTEAILISVPPKGASIFGIAGTTRSFTAVQ